MAKNTKKKAAAPTNKLTSEEFVKLLKNAAPQFSENELGDPLELLNKIGIRSPLIITGSESLRLRRLALWFADAFFSPSSELPISSLSGGNLNLSNVQPIINTLSSLSLFSRGRLVIISEAGAVKAAVAKPLAQAIRTQLSTFVVLLTKSINTKTPLPYNIQDIGTLVDVPELKGDSLKRWIAKEVRRNDIDVKIKPAAVDLLAHAYGNDLSSISQEIAKLCLLVERGGEIAPSLVSNIILKEADRTSFELFQQIAKKNAVRSVELTNKLLAQGFHPLQISNFLSRAIRTLLANKETSPTTRAELSSELANSWFLRNLTEAKQAFHFSELRDALQTVKELDLNLKSSGLPGPLLVTLAVQQLALRETTSASQQHA